jgi:hypothetical protein
MTLPPLHTRLHDLHRLSPSVQSAALLTTIDASTPAEAEAFAAELLELAARRRCRPRRRRRLLTQLCIRWPALSPRARLAVTLAAGRDLIAVVRDDPPAAASIAASVVDDGPVRDAARDLAIAGVLIRTIAASLLTALSDDPRAEPAARARACLPAMAATLAGDHPALVDLDRAITRAARDYPEHRDDAPLAAALLRATRPTRALNRWLDAETQPGHLALRRLVKDADDERFHADGVAWMSRHALAGVVLDRIGRDGGAAKLPTIAAAWPLLLHPRRARRLERAGKPRGLIGDLHHANTASEEHRFNVLRWLASTRMPSRLRVPMLAGRFTDPASRVRHTAVRSLAAQPPGVAVDTALIDFAFDRDERIAAVASRRLTEATGLHRRTAMAPSLEQLTRSPHRRVRMVAARPAAAAHPIPTLQGDAGRWLCPATARRMLAASPDTFIDHLDAAMSTGDPRMRAAALQLVSRFGLTRRLNDRLVALLATPDPLVAAAAVATLRKGSCTDAAPHLIPMLDHVDARVRASALEALAALDRDAVAFERFLDDDAPRLRANAARACLLIEPKHSGPRNALALLALDAMLTDERASHRRSALWAATRTRETRLLEAVDRIARDDTEPVLRRRALRCARVLSRSADLVAPHADAAAAVALEAA